MFWISLKNMKARNLSRNFLAALTLALFAMRGFAAAQEVPQFDDGNRLYEAGKFADAKEAYGKLMKTGPWSANLFYNLGNAEWKLGDAGQAALDYERALALRPGHPEARTNLEFVRNRTGARVFARSWWEEWLGVLNPTAAAVLGALCAWVFVFCMAARTMKPGARTAANIVLMLAALLGGAYAGGAMWMGQTAAGKATIIAKTTPARVAPADTAPAADTLPAGSEVLAPEARGAWTYCTLPSGARAWVATGAVERVALPAP